MMALVLDPPPHHQRLPLTCELHPNESFTGFCASCLRDRLSALESATTTATTHRNSTSTISSSLKSIFFKPNSNSNSNSNSSSFSSSSLHPPHLRRCKSFSFSANHRLSTSDEPQRRSCDVRGRNTLWSLFHQDDVTTSAVSDEITAVDPVVEVQTTREIEEEPELKPMKDHMDLESQAKKPPLPPPPPSSFWLAASVFSKKLQKWRRKQKLKKIKKQEEECRSDHQKSSRRFRETQSEIAVDAFGRRSCDLGPRFSLDAGRISIDDPRCSFDEPRASWDGYLVGVRSGYPRLPPMLSVLEDVPIQRSDGQIPVEEDLTVPGGTAQTKDYYSDSLSRSRRRSLDRSNSVKKLSGELNDANPVSNAKVSPTGSNEFFRDWSSFSFRDELPPRKKSKRWSKSWSLWGFIHRRSRGGGGDNVVERSFSEAWPELRMNGYHSNGRILRSNSSVSSRSSIYDNVGFGSMRRNGVETSGIGKKKRRDEFVLERSRSVRYSPGHIDNGMLRVYTTPMRGSRRGSGKGKYNDIYHPSFTGSVLRL